MNTYNELSQQIKTLTVKKGLNQAETLSEQSLEALAEELDNDFNAQNPAENGKEQSNEERMKSFTTYCLNMVSSDDVPDARKKAILTLLNLRLQGHN